MNYYDLPEGRPLTLADFANMPKGKQARLYYDSTNRGSFLWRQDRVEDDRVFGQFLYDEDSGWSSVGDYLYEFMGEVCRGSGAEPVWAGSYPDGSGRL